MGKTRTLVVSIGSLVVAGTVGGLVALGVASAGQPAQGSSQVQQHAADDASATASPSPTDSPVVEASSPAAPIAPTTTEAARVTQAQGGGGTDAAPQNAAPADDSTPVDTAPTVPGGHPTGPIYPVHPVDPGGPDPNLPGN